MRMPSEKVASAADHRGVALKSRLIGHLTARGIETIDLGTDGAESVDYPQFAAALARIVASGEADAGVLICGTGIGMSIAANRHPGVRAALCYTPEAARMARAHNDANVLCLGADVTPPDVAVECLETFLATPFEGGRHERRVGQLG